MEAIVAELIAVIGSIIVALIGWGHVRMNALSKRIDELDANKMSVKEFHEIKDDVKTILKEITKIQVEQARWQGRAEAERSKQEKS